MHLAPLIDVRSLFFHLTIFSAAAGCASLSGATGARTRFGEVTAHYGDHRLLLACENLGTISGLGKGRETAITSANERAQKIGANHVAYLKGQDATLLYRVEGTAYRCSQEIFRKEDLYAGKVTISTPPRVLTGEITAGWKATFSEGAAPFIRLVANDTLNMNVCAKKVYLLSESGRTEGHFECGKLAVMGGNVADNPGPRFRTDKIKQLAKSRIINIRISEQNPLALPDRLRDDLEALLHSIQKERSPQKLSSAQEL